MRGTPLSYKMTFSHVAARSSVSFGASILLKRNVLVSSSITEPVFVVDVSGNGEEQRFTVVE